MSNAIILARVSTERQEQEGLSLEEIQLPRLRKYADEKGLTIVSEFVFSETADNKMREKFDEMVEFVKKDKSIDAIIAFRVDRITRNFRDAVAMDDLRNKYEKELHFVDDRLVINKNSKSSEISQWDLKVFLAKQYINRLKDDARNTRYTKLENGELPWKAPYGYKNIELDKRHKDVIKDDFASGVVIQIFKQYASGAYSLESLVRKINKDYNLRLPKSTIQHLLRHKFYIGFIYDRETDTYYPHKYEQFISKELFEEANSILDGHRKRKFKYLGLSFDYRGLLVCADCGCAMTPERKIKKLKDGSSQEHKYYHCTQRRGKHNTEWLTEKDIEEQFKGVFDSITIPKEEAERIEEVLRQSHHSKTRFNQAQLAECQNQYSLLQKRIEKTYDLLADGSITQPEYDQNNRRYRQQQDKYRDKMQRLQRADEQYYLTSTYILKLAKNADKLFAVANPEEKRQLINLVCQNLKIQGKKLLFELKTPFDTIAECSNRSIWLPGPDSNRQPSD